MKRRTEVVVLEKSEAELSRWRLVLGVHGYTVFGALYFPEAIRLLRDNPDCRMVLTRKSTDAEIVRMQRDGEVSVLLFGCLECRALESVADEVQVAGPEMMARVLKALWLISLRRPGPRKACSRAPKRRSMAQDAAAYESEAA